MLCKAIRHSLVLGVVLAVRCSGLPDLVFVGKTDSSALPRAGLMQISLIYKGFFLGPEIASLQKHRVMAPDSLLESENSMQHPMRRLVATTVSSLVLAAFGSLAHAAPIYWTDWTGGDLDSSSGFKAEGTITTTTSSVTVTYTNANGIAFYQPSGGIDYYQNNRAGRNPATSPYTSTAVDNIPTGTDIIALTQAGMQTLKFSQTIANPVFSYVSLNGNGYAFDQDFEILSFGHPSNGNDCGYWGCGTSSKNVVDLGGGNFEYQLLGTGEPHGTLRFLGAFDTVSWRSLSSEYWNGFTVGVQGTAAEVFETPEPSGIALVGVAMLALVGLRARRVL